VASSKRTKRAASVRLSSLDKADSSWTNTRLYIRGAWGLPVFWKGRGDLRMTIFRRLGLALVAVAALAVWLASGAMAESRQVPIGGTGSAQTGDFTPSSDAVTQDEFPSGESGEEGPDPYQGTISFSTGAGGGPT